MVDIFEGMSQYPPPIIAPHPHVGVDQFPGKSGWVNTRRRRKTKAPHRQAKRQRQAVASLPEKTFSVDYAQVELRGFKVLKELFPNVGSDRIVSELREKAFLPYPERVAQVCNKLSENSVVGGSLSRSKTEPSPAPLKVPVEKPRAPRVSLPTADVARAWHCSADAEMDYWIDNQERVFVKRDPKRYATTRAMWRPYVLDWRALRYPVPSAAVLNAVAIARCSAGLDEDPEEVLCEEDTSKPISFEEVQHRFLKKHSAKLSEELGPWTELAVASTSPVVQERFWSQLLRFGCPEPLVAFHGTAKRNFHSILSQGLRIPGNGGVRVIHGSAHGVGIYTAKQGASFLSKTFCDSDQMLVCGVIDDGSKIRDHCRQPRLRPTHKSTRKPVGTKSQARMLGRQVLHRDGVVRHVGSAMVIFDESRVAPLLVASNIARPGTTWLPGWQQIQRWPPRNSNVVQDGSLGRRQFRIGGERVFESWQPGHYSRSAKAVKRRIVGQLRHLRLVGDRSEKASAADQWDA